MVDILRTIVQHDYEFVMVVDLSTGRYVKYVGSDAYAHIPEQGDHATQVCSVAERFVLPEDRDEYLEKMSLPVIAAMLESRKKPSFTYRRRKLSGEIAWLKANFIYASEEKRSVIIAYYDDTEEVVARLNERKKIELQDEGIRFMAQNLCEDFLIADLESGACSMVTPDTGNMVAKGTFKEQVDWFAENIVAPEEREAYLRYFNLANLVPHIRKNNGFCTMNCTVIYKDGRHNFVVATTLIRDPIEPEKEYLFAYAQDITRLKQVEYKNKELFLQSRRDPVTGLCNRVATEQDIDEYLHSSQRGGEGLLLILDVDFFKSFNDNYGHAVGDEVLASVAEAMRGVFRKEDILCRWGGDEFLIFIKEFGSLRAVTERIVRLRRQMKGFSSGGRALPVSLSVGGAVAGQATHGLDELFQKADMALYDVKHEGRDGLVILGEDGERLV